jgi:transposase
MKRYGLRDDQFARIETLLPGRPGTVGRNSKRGNRLFVEAVIWKFRSGAPWRDLPERFGDWKNTHKRFSRWAASGVWERLFKTLADDPDNEYAMIDARHVCSVRDEPLVRRIRVAPPFRDSDFLLL